MIQIALPPPEIVLQHWDDVAPFLQRAVDYSNGELSVDILKQRVAERDVVVATVFDDGKLISVISFDTLNFETGMKALNIQCAGGERIDEWYEDIEKIANELAKKNGCSHVYIIGREGWMRKMKHLGYKTVHTVIAKEVI